MIAGLNEVNNGDRVTWNGNVYTVQEVDYDDKSLLCKKIDSQYGPTWINWDQIDAHEITPGSVDAVNHPPHYTQHPSGVEWCDIAEHFNFCVGNAIKYLWRAGLKGDALEDLRKAAWYVQREIERREKGGVR